MIHAGDLFSVLPTLAESSIDACVCDPPYELGFMGKHWDGSGVAFGVETWKQVFRALKPGAHLVAFGGTRTYHRMVCAIEDAGFEIRDQLAWIYGSGFPKSLNVSKAIDEAAGQIGHSVSDIKRKLQNGVSERRLTLAQLNSACGFEASGYLRESSTWATVLPSFDKWIVMRDVLGLSNELDGLFREAEREVIGRNNRPAGWFTSGDGHNITESATDAAKQWDGWGTALKPAFEPIVLARKPFKGTVAQNVLTHGTGALNIDACRIGMSNADRQAYIDKRESFDSTTGRPSGGWKNSSPQLSAEQFIESSQQGRWPANVLLDEDAAALLDEQSGELTSGAVQHSIGDPVNSNWRANEGRTDPKLRGADKTWALSVGGASRFFYVAKPSREERDYGCYDLPAKSGGEATDRIDGSAGVESPRAGAGRTGGSRNHHPTVKPVELMRWLVRLVTPPGGTVLDPFMGSGTTGMACRYELRKFIGIEREAEYVAIAERRIAACAPLFSDEATA